MLIGAAFLDGDIIQELLVDAALAGKNAGPAAKAIGDKRGGVVRDRVKGEAVIVSRDGKVKGVHAGARLGGGDNIAPLSLN